MRLLRSVDFIRTYCVIYCYIIFKLMNDPVKISPGRNMETAVSACCEIQPAAATGWRKLCIILLSQKCTLQSSTEVVNLAQSDTMSSDSLDTEQLTSAFLSTCTGALDIVAPLKLMRPRAKSEPWLNDVTRAAMRECRQAERRWKKDKLHVAHDILKESWRKYQSIVKAEKISYLSDIISSNLNKPCVLFKTIDAMFNSPLSTCIEASTEVCQKCLCYFIDKISTIRASISPPSFDPSIDITCTAVFQQFGPVSLSSLCDIVAK